MESIMINTPYKGYKRFLWVVLAISLGGMATIFMLDFVADPFNMNGIFDFGFDKRLVSYRSNYRLYKIIEYNKQPVPNIILGDSRMEALDTRLIAEASGQNYFNFAYGGGTLYEAIDTFWYAAGMAKLKNVYIGVNFNVYNKIYSLSLVPEAVSLASRPLIYYVSPFVAKISLYNIIYRLTGLNLASERPPMSKEEFWAQRLGAATDYYYGTYIYPYDALKSLHEIMKYCEDNAIKLSLIIFPTHVELQDKVQEYGLSAEYDRYKVDLRSVAPVIDFDYPNEWTKNKQLFIDPYHFNEEIMQALIDEIWRHKLRIGKMQ
jgi:hypothetical protein